MPPSLVPEDLLAQLAAAATATAVALEPAGHDALLQAVVDAAKDLFEAAACSLALLDEQTDEIVYRVASGAGAAEVVGLRMPLGRGVGGWVVASGMPIAIDDLAADPRFGRDTAEKTGYLPRSILATPLETEHTVLGVLSVFDRVPPADVAAAQRETSVLGLFARQAALAIDAARVYRSIAEALLGALRAAADGDQAVQVLERATQAPGADQRVLDLAALFARLGRADQELLGIAAATVEDFVRYAERRAAL